MRVWFTICFDRFHDFKDRFKSILVDRLYSYFTALLLIVSASYSSGASNVPDSFAIHRILTFCIFLSQIENIASRKA